MTEKTSGLNIKAVADRTGVSLHTLRAWERRYGVPSPTRVPNNRYRIYDEQDVADVLWLKRQVEAGVSPVRASALLQEQKHGVPAPPSEPGQPIAEKRTALLSALLASDETAAQQIVDQVWALFTPEQVTLQIIQPVMQAIGEQWLHNKTTIWQEHLVSNLIRRKLLSVLQAQPPPVFAAPRLIAACAPEEEHELGLIVFSLLAARQGWHVTFLGQRTPLGELAHFGHDVQLIVLSVATVTGAASLIPLWLPENRPQLPIIFGGNLLNQVPALREHLPGAFIGTDAAEAVRTLSTTTTRTQTWAPRPEALKAALEIQAARLQLGWLTLDQLVPGPKRPLSPRRSIRAQELSGPTLFLIDTIASALAFEVPEMIDIQGSWLRALLLAHGVEYKLLQQHIDSFTRACQQLLPKETTRLVAPLLQRLLATAEH